MDEQLERKRRDTSRFFLERTTIQALKSVAPSIAACNGRLARCRAIANFAKGGYTAEVLAECRDMRRTVSELRKQLRQIVETLPRDQQSSSRIRDVRNALDHIETGVAGILETVAAVTISTTARQSGSSIFEDVLIRQ
jgi:hypothetical protein